MLTNEDLYRTDLPQTVHKVLCLISGGISTTIAASPTLEAIHQIYPSALITVVMPASCAPLLKGMPFVHKILPYHQLNTAQALGLSGQLFSEKYDLLFDFYTPQPQFVKHSYERGKLLPPEQAFDNQFVQDQQILKFHLLIRGLAWPKISVGFTVDPLDYKNPLLRWVGRFLRFSINIPVPKKHIAKNENLADTSLRLLIDPKKIDIAAPLFPKHISQQHDFKDNLLSKKLKNPKTSVAGIHVCLFFGGRRKSTHWPIDNVIEFVQKCTASFDAQVHIIGGIHEREYNAQIKKELRSELQSGVVTNHIDKLSLAMTSALVAQSSIMVSTLGGPLHLADAHNVPLITLASSNVNIRNYSAREARQILLHTPVDCSPCFHETCFKSVSCMERITASQVVAAVNAMIADRFSRVELR